LTRDRENLYFYVRTDKDITPRTDPNWMWLLIDVKGTAGPDWEGFNFLVNRRTPGPQTA